jgi:hypothetical protein
MKTTFKLIGVLAALAFASAVVRAEPTIPDNCVAVTGQLEITSINPNAIHGAMTGDLTGARHIQVDEHHVVITPLGPVHLIKGHGVIVTEQGKLFTHDHVKILPETKEHPHIFKSKSKIIGGTGIYQGKHGHIKAQGPIGPDADPLNYQGAICEPVA